MTAPLILGTNSIKDEGYVVDNSLRFNDSSDKLSRTPSSDGNQQSFTVSFWSKRGQITANNIMVHGVLANSDFMIYYNTSDQLQIATNLSGVIYGLRTDRLFRDPSAWYHIVVSLDTTSATASSRIKVYINGSQETSLNNTSYPPQNSNISWNKTSLPQNIGHYVDDTSIGYKGYITEFVNIDGSTLTPTSFGEFDEDTGIWKPIDVSGLTFGTNGFYLDFEDSSALGNDVSGNNNDFTVNNLTSIDQTTDTCTNNFATANPLTQSSATYSNGNLTLSGGNDLMGTIGVSQGKWYWEVKKSNTTGTWHSGIVSTESASGSTTQFLSGTNTNSGAIWINESTFITGRDGNTISNYTHTDNISSVSNGDIFGFALDLDSSTKKITYYQNGSEVGNTTFTYDGITPVFPYFRMNTGVLADINFGNPPFSISSGNSDSEGHGNFEFSVPSGYYALNTKNLAEYG